MIEPLRPALVPQVVRVHLAGFQGFFLSFLGPRFLRLYYEAIATYPGAAAYVWTEQSDVVGFVCGTAGSSGFYRYLLRTRWLRFALAASGAALRQPSVIPRLFRAWRYPDQASPDENSATLTSITVEPGHQGRGIGRELVAAFLEAMRARGMARVELTTDRDGNNRTNAFYAKLGFRRRSTVTTPEGRVMNVYEFDLNGDPVP